MTEKIWKQNIHLFTFACSAGVAMDTRLAPPVEVSSSGAGTVAAKPISSNPSTNLLTFISCRQEKESFKLVKAEVL